MLMRSCSYRIDYTIPGFREQDGVTVMQLSAEIRWFWKGSSPAQLAEWFSSTAAHPCPPGGGESRVGEYLSDSRQSELGLKRRGGKPGVEVKGLVALSFSTLAAGDFVGPIELWTKWTTEILELEPKLTIPIKKVRWLRKFDTTLPVVAEVPLDSKRSLWVGFLSLHAGATWN
jgi:hypothetical protein